MSLCYLYAMPTSLLFANSIKTIKPDELNQKIASQNKAIIIIDFWSTWCLPCQKQVSVLSRVYERYKSRGLSIIGISLNFDEEKKKVEKFINKEDIKYPVYLGGQDTAFSYNINALPTMNIYDKEGNLIGNHVGFTGEEELENIINNILEKK